MFFTLLLWISRGYLTKKNSVGSLLKIPIRPLSKHAAWLNRKGGRSSIGLNLYMDWTGSSSLKGDFPSPHAAQNLYNLPLFLDPLISPFDNPGLMIGLFTYNNRSYSRDGRPITMLLHLRGCVLFQYPSSLHHPVHVIFSIILQARSDDQHPLYIR